MQMIYLLHSTFDEALMRRLRRTLDRGLRGVTDRAEALTANDNADAFEVAVTDQELAEDLEFGRAA